MEFAGKAYIKRRAKKLPDIVEKAEEEDLEESKAVPLAVPQPPRLRRQRSYEALSVGSLDHSLDSQSDEDEKAEELPDSFEDYQEMAQQRAPGREVYDVRVDTNVVSVNLGSLEQESMVATGEPAFCVQCRAVLSMFSELRPLGDGSQLWKCEFCEHQNVLQIDEEEFPSAPTLDYLLLSKNQLAEQHQVDESRRNTSVIFCIDISGSMCVSEPIQGKLKLKTHKEIDLQGFTDFDMEEQFMPGENQLTYVSRLECVQAAIEAQLNVMGLETPDRKVGLVTFNSDVTIYGDGTTDTYTITGDRLNSFQACFDAGNSWASKMEHTLEHTKASLVEKLLQLSEGGPTALGPALATSLGLASNGKPGSKVVLCTDGLANIGGGRLDDPSLQQEAENFYAEVTAVARERGIEVSVISIEGEQCRLSVLSKICDATSGEVTRVNPLNIASEFSSILTIPVIATEVEAIVKLHKALTFRYEQQLFDPSTLKKDLGSVTSESEFTFEYSLKPQPDLESLGIDLDALHRIPFQTQIHYTNLQGNRLMRVISSVQEAVDDLDEAVQDVNFEVLGVNAAQRSAQLASQGEYRQAQTVMRSWKRMMNRNAKNSEEREKLDYYMGNLAMFNHNLREAQPEECQDATSHMAFRAKRANRAQKKDCTIM